MRSALERVRGMGSEIRRSLAESLLAGRGPHDVPPRLLEHSVYTFDAVMDQGAYLEVKRHRMMTQSAQRLSADLGYTVPRKMAEAGLEGQYRQAMERAAEAHAQLAAENPEAAAYVVPNGFRRRVLMTLNLREAYHFCELRSAPNAHFSVRRIALRMAELIREVHPLLGQWMSLPEGAEWKSIETENFLQV